MAPLLDKLLKISFKNWIFIFQISDIKRPLNIQYI
jgi:hypothetical protein